MNSHFKNKTGVSWTVAKEFIKLYYRAFDTRAHKISRVYVDQSVFNWNGNGVYGKDDIEKYILELPNSRHRLTSLDIDPIRGGQLTFTMEVGGKAYYGAYETRPFKHTFVITVVENDQWKIVADCYRFRDA